MIGDPEFDVITVENETGRARVPVKPLRDIAQLTIEGEKREISEVIIVLVDGQTMLDINRRVFEHDWETDVVTLVYNEDPDDAPKTSPIDCEAYVCIDVAERQADELGVSTTNELLRLIVHAMLHACGWKDDTDEQREAMRLREDFFLEEYYSRRRTTVE